MAVDIKQLRIGSHVEVMDRMCEIDSIGGGTQIGCIDTNTWEEVDAEEDWVNPIPITPELLGELGFEKVEEFGQYSVFIKENIEVGIVGARVYARLEQGILRDVKSLHELENFIYLTLGKELMEK